MKKHLKEAKYLVIIVSGAIASAITLPAIAKTPEEVGQIACDVSVQINSTGNSGDGSGVIIAKNGDIYTVLTANHVKRDVGVNPIVQPCSDSKSHSVLSFQSLGDLNNQQDPDLAVLTFKATDNYKTATLGDSSQIKLGSNIYVFGYPVEGIGANRKRGSDREARFSPGSVVSIRKKALNGNFIVYNAVTKGGMSGGPVFDVEGRVVAVHTSGDLEEGQGQVESGQTVTVRVKTGTNAGVPISAFLAKRGQIGTNVQNVAVNNEPSTEKPEEKLKNPQSTGDFVVAGMVESEKGDDKAAIDSFSEAIKRDSNSAEAYYRRGISKYRRGDKQGAVEDYGEAIKLNPDYSNAYYNRASIRFFELNDYPGAVADYTEALRLNPNDAISYFNRAAARSKLKDREGVVADFTEAIRVKPTYVEAYIERGRFRNTLGDRKGAIEDFTSAIELAPENTVNHPIALYNRAAVRRNIKDLTGAVEDFQKASELFPGVNEPELAKKAADEVYWLNREIKFESDRKLNPSTPAPKPSNPAPDGGLNEPI
ncbi:tetratricopeptide repeat-containing S1 family peptidase [Merismopedia glauca]|uniref:tetratricopeptide repeat-containing S1 family peptidase n=1 Tax=Merismopedia glauca TaxID=292586 RepID=UPI0011B1D668|nr:tetratricopeptide repeat-containing serine protease family protein [Merismopedia glauca]